MKTFNNILLIAATFSLAVTVSANAGEKSTTNPFFVVLQSTPSAELPAKAADLVLNADLKERQETTINVVKASVPLDPASVPAIVASIGSEVPGMAAIAVSTAVGLVPEKVVAIVRAAAAAAPSQAKQIVAAACRLCPNSYQKIAEAVAEVVPDANKEILLGLTQALPQLKSGIEQALAKNNGTVVSVASVLNDIPVTEPVAATVPIAISQSPATEPIISAPIVGPPYVPPPPGHTPVDPGSGGQVPPPIFAREDGFYFSDN
jgi:hypothetical protein